MTEVEKRNEAIATLNELGYIALLWHTDDIIGCLTDKGYDSNVITIEEAKGILSSIESNHDAGYGVNWDTIEYYVDEFIKEKGLEEPTNDEDDE